MDKNCGVKKKIISAGRGMPAGIKPMEYPKETKFYFHYQIRKCDDELTVLDDTKKYGKKMELYTGKEFQLPIWELCLETMMPGEVSSFTVEEHHLRNFPAVNKKLRDYMLNKHIQGTAHHCCGMMAMKDQGGLGYKDLDELMEKPQSLEFIFELVDVEIPGEVRKEAWIMSPEEKIEVLPKLREEGNELFKASDYKSAADKYSEALGMLEQLVLREKPGEPEWKELDNLKVPYLLNLAQCKLNMKEYYEVIQYTTDAIERDPDNVKAHFRRAKAHMAVWNMKEAENDFKMALQLDPSLSKTINKDLILIEKLLKEKNMEEKERFKGIFDQKTAQT